MVVDLVSIGCILLLSNNHHHQHQQQQQQQQTSYHRQISLSSYGKQQPPPKIGATAIRIRSSTHLLNNKRNGSAAGSGRASKRSNRNSSSSSCTGGGRSNNKSMNSQAARQAATKRALEIVKRSSNGGGGNAAAANETHVWNFGFGANINPKKLCDNRNIQPIESICGKVPNCRLLFNHRGGFGNIDLSASSESVPELQLSNNNNKKRKKINHPTEVHGMALRLTHHDFGRLAGMEHQYDPQEVVVSTYDGRFIKALAFITNDCHQTINRGLLPTDRYLNLIKNGAKQMGIDSAYRKWLEQIPSIPDRQRGSEYYQTQSSLPMDTTNRVQGKEGAPDKNSNRRNDTTSNEPNSNSNRKHGKEDVRTKKKKKNITTTDKHTIYYEVGSKPAGIFLSGNKLYVSDSNSNAIKRVLLTKGSSSNNSNVSNNNPKDDAMVVVVAGGHGRGDKQNQLNRPWRLFVDEAHNIYVVDRNNNRVQKWSSAHDKKGEKVVTTVAGGNGPGAKLSQLDQPVDVYVINNANNNDGNDSDGVDIYVSDRANHRVVKWNSAGKKDGATTTTTTRGTVVAGGNGFGSKMNQLGCPGGLHVTTNGTIYVSDEANNRVMKWEKNGTTGTIVVGGHGAGNQATQLYHPLGLWVSDNEERITVADSLGYRVQQFRLPAAITKNSSNDNNDHHNDAFGGNADGIDDESSPPLLLHAETIAGVNGKPSGTIVGYLGQPMTVQINKQDGALFVADSDYSRVQRYSKKDQDTSIQKNNDCDDGSATSRKDQSSLIIQKIVGRCTKYNVKSGYGFIIEIASAACDTTNNNNSNHPVSYFAHHSDIVDPSVQYGYPTLSKGDMVTFEAKRDAKWKWRGTNIQKARPQQQAERKEKEEEKVM